MSIIDMLVASLRHRRLALKELAISGLPSRCHQSLGLSGDALPDVYAKDVVTALEDSGVEIPDAWRVSQYDTPLYEGLWRQGMTVDIVRRLWESRFQDAYSAAARNTPFHNLSTNPLICTEPQAVADDIIRGLVSRDPEEVGEILEEDHDRLARFEELVPQLIDEFKASGLGLLELIDGPYQQRIDRIIAWEDERILSVEELKAVEELGVTLRHAGDENGAD
ncbi:hypothetical protein LTR85_008711 [Meristemomyces frigidus]|nr:hypothetical protein LTR85_008711 [Meristemomyces frigidus]